MIFSSRKKIKSCVRLISIFFAGSMMMVSYAEDNQNQESAQQALEQLRMFQKKLSDNSPTSNNTSAPSPLTPPVITPPKPFGAMTTPMPSDDLSKHELDEIIEEKAFETVEKQLFPLSPEKLHKIHKKYEQQEYALAAPANVPPKPTATSQFVNLSPGSTPPVVRLAQGFVSSLVFLDSTGAPWPIVAYDLGDPSSFNIQWDHTGNTLMIQAQKLYNYGNLAVRLKGLNTPVMLTLIPGQKAVDYRVDMRVQGYGPNAQRPLLDEGLPAHANNLLLHVLDGVPPNGSQRLSISGGDALGWLYHEKMYIRTNLTILSPAWMATMTSADGTHAYEMMKSPVILVSWHGKVMQLKVEGL
jgi:intracellular multiplication protein IcmK